jgi:hypothetical protein
MNTVFNLLLTPFGRAAAVVIVLALAFGGLYVKIRSDAIAEVQAKATADALGRVQDAVRAGDSVDTSSSGLLKDDGHRRD